MNKWKKGSRLLAYLLTLPGAALAALHFYRARSPAGTPLVAPKLLAGALSPMLAVAGLFGAGLALVARAPIALIAGLFATGVSARYVWDVVSSGADFRTAFGAEWREQLAPEQQARMRTGRWTWRPPAPPEPRLEQDIPFCTIPGEERALLADIWQPPAGVPRSGLAFIYFHGSGWHFLDKDVGTRPMFRHLAAQGHVLMDVAYRLCPETNWQGMVGDVWRAVSWMKANATRFGVDPEQIVLGGGSAGGHLALLAAYAADQPELRPADVAGADLQVQGVVAWYGPADMRAFWEHAEFVFGNLVAENDDGPGDRMTNWMTERLGFAMQPPTHWQAGVTVRENMMRALLGGRPDQVPEIYDQASPISYAGPSSPPTLLLHGEHDSIVPPESTRRLAEKLVATGAPIVHVAYPRTEHAFDLILPRLSPTAQAALYETERFLAILAAASPRGPRQPAEMRLPEVQHVQKE